MRHQQWGPEKACVGAYYRKDVEMCKLFHLVDEYAQYGLYQRPKLCFLNHIKKEGVEEMIVIPKYAVFHVIFLLNPFKLKL